MLSLSSMGVVFLLYFVLAISDCTDKSVTSSLARHTSMVRWMERLSLMRTLRRTSGYCEDTIHSLSP
jgi:hypothetical protein